MQAFFIEGQTFLFFIEGQTFFIFGQTFFIKKYPEFSNAIILNKVNSAMNTDPSSSETVKPELKQEPKIEPKTYLKLKYLTESNKVLIEQDDKWVEKSEHKFLRFILINLK